MDVKTFKLAVPATFTEGLRNGPVNAPEAIEQVLPQVLIQGYPVPSFAHLKIETRTLLDEELV